ncbi:MAG TPA: antibiotic biosynthesis monooxygenase [Terrimicrobiaceae bacterium]
MNKTALFIRHKAQPGRRDDLLRIWQRHVRPRVEANPAHEAYFYCFDDSDPDVVCVFQLYSNEAARKDFLTGEWYPAYLDEVSQVVAAPPQISPASLVWSKYFTGVSRLEQV